ncbi:putative lipoprotein [Vibrio orientalis CIP 102891 = ATCC 33934]|uniref:Putative lipoprotein n=1 Tax=Vibrio orientalis CIP 102891 = ATCC 33934 TaxID=675816 RepID=C9QHP0_VIBOR|nr:hypothetical protein [Vibrio orientalis]EEX91723.1 hypothetical protein VIA_002365 [Vibrio orientalis CIP 102891 = ATCC 33934]EGU45094.1 putative lipoprotein [Vibrio orientalis CIP 102891 = ATCC 33934]
MCNAKMKLYLSLLFASLLVACGGGGGGESTGSSSSGASTGSEGGSESTSATEQTLSLTELQIEHSNNLTSVYSVDIDVSLPHLAAAQVYISICDNSIGGLENVDYNKCLVKAALQSGQGQYQLRVPNHCQSLIAVVSIMEPDVDPLVYTLNHNNQAQTTWLIQ